MKRLRKLLFPTVLLFIVVAMSWLFMTNLSLISELQHQGKQPVSVLPAVPTIKGDKGDSPTPDEIAQAVADYCATTGSCEGRLPSQAIVFAAVSQYCANNGCKGGDGKDAEITPAQIQAQVVAFCANSNCVGAAGDTGETGLNGLDGRSPFIACVIRMTDDIETRYIAWKYETEADTAYRDLYRLPLLAECTNPIDLKT